MRNAIATVGLTVLLSALAWARPAGATCTIDTDCPTPACGGEVCQWSASAHNCVAAGTDPQGTDGWCNVDSDCKCMGEGATCVSPHCTFTLSREGGTASSSGGSASSSGADGSAHTPDGSAYSSSSGGPTYSSGGGSGAPPVAMPPTLTDATTLSGSSSPTGSGGCTVALAGLGGGREGSWKVVLGLGLAALLASRRKR
jgi:hypothetical protein